MVKMSYDEIIYIREMTKEDISEITDPCPLAVSMLGNRKELGSAFHDDHFNHIIVLVERDRAIVIHALSDTSSGQPFEPASVDVAVSTDQERRAYLDDQAAIFGKCKTGHGSGR